MDYVDRVSALERAVAEGRVIRGAWTEGHERACLLAWLSPEAGAAESAGACPATVMPPWLAHMTPSIDDRTSAAAWPGVIARYAALARRWHALDATAWERARVATLIAIVREARTHCPASETQPLTAIDGVIAWLERGAPESERENARRAAQAASASASAWAAARAASASAWAAEAAAWAAAEAWAAEAAAWASARAASASAWASARAAEAWDRIAAATLDAIEAECVRAEAA